MYSASWVVTLVAVCIFFVLQVQSRSSKLQSMRSRISENLVKDDLSQYNRLIKSPYDRRRFDKRDYTRRLTAPRKRRGETFITKNTQQRPFLNNKIEVNKSPRHNRMSLFNATDNNRDYGRGISLNKNEANIFNNFEQSSNNLLPNSNIIFVDNNDESFKKASNYDNEHFSAESLNKNKLSELERHQYINPVAFGEDYPPYPRVKKEDVIELSVVPYKQSALLNSITSKEASAQSVNESDNVRLQKEPQVIENSDQLPYLNVDPRQRKNAMEPYSVTFPDVRAATPQANGLPPSYGITPSSYSVESPPTMQNTFPTETMLVPVQPLPYQQIPVTNYMNTNQVPNSNPQTVIIGEIPYPIKPYINPNQIPNQNLPVMMPQTFYSGPMQMIPQVFEPGAMQNYSLKYYNQEQQPAREQLLWLQQHPQIPIQEIMRDRLSSLTSHFLAKKYHDEEYRQNLENLKEDESDGNKIQPRSSPEDSHILDSNSLADNSLQSQLKQTNHEPVQKETNISTIVDVPTVTWREFDLNHYMKSKTPNSDLSTIGSNNIRYFDSFNYRRNIDPSPLINNADGGLTNYNDALSQIMSDLEEIKMERKNGQGREGLPCNINGSWVSDVAGIRLDLYVLKNGTLKITTGSCVPPREGGLLSCAWTLDGEAPFPHNGLFSIYAKNTASKRFATFLGQCRVCGGSELVTGTWLISRESRDCRDTHLSVTQHPDIFRKEMIHALKNKQLRAANTAEDGIGTPLSSSPIRSTNTLMTSSMTTETPLNSTVKKNWFGNA